MPGRDGTGPMGQGPMTGGGFGACSTKDVSEKETVFGLGLGRRLGARFAAGIGRGLGRGMGFGAGRGRGFWKR